MTKITAIELSTNYPDNIKIGHAQGDNGKFIGLCYMTRDGNIHKLMLSTKPAFDTGEDAEEFMHDVAKNAQKYIQ